MKKLPLPAKEDGRDRFETCVLGVDSWLESAARSLNEGCIISYSIIS